MIRCSAALVIGALIGPAFGADDPAPKAGPKPPWQRVLTGEDARVAAELWKRMEQAVTKDQTAEAVRSAEQLLALRTRVQGADHWEAVSQRWAVDALKRVADLPVDKRAGWRASVAGLSAARNFETMAEFGKALPLREKALKWARDVYGEDHPTTAHAYNELALNLAAQGRAEAAGPLVQTALDVFRKALGERHPDTLAGYNNLASHLADQGLYADADPLYRKALDGFRAVHGEAHPDTATGYNNLARNLTARARYGDADPVYQKALSIRRGVYGDDDPVTGASYNDWALNLTARARFEEADRLYRKALDISRTASGEAHPDTAAAYNNLALNFAAQGRYAEAGPLLQKALDITRGAFGETHPDTAQSYNNLASNLAARGLYTDADPLYRKALDGRRASLGETHPVTAQSYGNLGRNLTALTRYAEADPPLRKALDISRAAHRGAHQDTAAGYTNLARNLADQGLYADADPLYRKALDGFRAVHGEAHPDTATGYNNLARNSAARGLFADAGNSLRQAAQSYESSRLSVARGGLDRASFGAERSPYQLLATTLVRTSDPTAAWEAAEADLARGLLDQVADPTSADTAGPGRPTDRLGAIQSRVLVLATRRDLTPAEGQELEGLRTERARLEEKLSGLAAAASRRQVADLATVRAGLPDDAALVFWVDTPGPAGQFQDHLGCVVRRNGDPRWERLSGTGAGGAWTRDDDARPARLRNALSGAVPAAETNRLAADLRTQRLAPLAKHLAGVKSLYVVPAGPMAGIPIELLAAEYTVGYVPSGTVLAKQTGRPPAAGRGLLAVGDPQYPPPVARPASSLPAGGLLVTQVIPDGAGAKAGVKPGDVLLSYAGRDLSSADALKAAIAGGAAAETNPLVVWREGEAATATRPVPAGKLGVVLDPNPAPQAVAARRQSAAEFAVLTRGGGWAELPGTAAEVAGLAALFGDAATVLTRADAGPRRLAGLQTANKMAGYRYVHFATHGEANDVKAFESALILSGTDTAVARLTAREVLDGWKLDADLVTLSACESGLGRAAGGDGLLGFAQAFLAAGSRSVCLSLWKVDDAATTLLMARFYENLLGKRPGLAGPLGKAAALAEAKRWLRDLPADEAATRAATLSGGTSRGKGEPVRLTLPAAGPAAAAGRPFAHPRYWAAFVLIGDPN